MSLRIERVGDFTLTWGESLVWDERRERLYFAVTTDDGRGRVEPRYAS